MHDCFYKKVVANRDGSEHLYDVKDSMGQDKDLTMDPEDTEDIDLPISFHNRNDKEHLSVSIVNNLNIFTLGIPFPINNKKSNRKSGGFL